MIKATLKHLILVGVAVFITQTIATTPAYAINPSDFNPGRIIDDELFYNKDDMSVADIQNFLNAHVAGPCDTWGTQKSGYGNLTNAQYAQQIQKWPGPPYVCLNNYHENPDTHATSFENGGGAFPGGISAAQIIYNAAQQYRINPKVLLVTLRKEQGSLFYDNWPLKTQYKYAMGYACPDSGPNYSAACVDSKSGFYNQMSLAAWQFRYYYDHMGTYNFTPGRWNTIQYNPQPSCGTKDVYIQNYATASLYIYTPYTPNDAALNAYPGQAHCGAYGNRNFWFMWQEWFGSTHAKATLESNLTLLSSVPGMGLFTHGFVEASFVIKNNTSSTLDLGTIAVACRDSVGGNCDFPGVNVTLPPGQSYLYRQARNITKEDKYSFWITSYVGGQWNDATPSSATTQIRRYDGKLVQHKPTLTQGIAVRGSDVRIGGIYPVTFTIRNNSAFPLATGNIAVGMISPSGRNSDLNAVNVGDIPAAGEYAYSSAFVPREAGTYTASVLQTPNFSNWNTTNLLVPATGVSGGAQITSKQNPSITENITLNPASARVGDPVNLSIKMTNFANVAVDGGNIGAVIRDPNNRNVDMSIRPVGQVASGATHVSTEKKTFSSAGVYKADPISYVDGKWVNPQFEDAKKPTQVSFTIKPNVTLTQGLVVNNPNPFEGDTITGSFKVKNFSTVSAQVNKTLCYIVRGPNSTNFDLGCLNLGTLAPGEEKTFSASRKIPVAGTYNAFFSMYDGEYWHDNWVLPKETGSEAVTTSFIAKTNPTLTQGLTISNTAPLVGETITGSFKVRNMNGQQQVAVNKTLCYIVRGPNSTNFDLGCMNVGTLAPNEVKVFEVSRKIALAGGYRAFFSMYDGEYWHDNWTFSQDTGTEPTTLSFIAK